MFDNSVAASVTGVPSPVLVLEMREGRISHVVDLPQVPEWAKPIVAAAIREDLGWGAAPAPR